MNRLRTFVSASLLIAAVLASSAYFAYSHLAAPQPPKTSEGTIRASSSAAAETELAARIDRAIGASDVKQARWGVFVVSLKDGRVLCSRNGDQLFTPASNMKVFTTAVALDLLGGDYRWRTSVYSIKPPDAAGVIEGDLTLYGRGAPDLVSTRKGAAPSLEDLAEQLYQRGVREVRGNIVGDSSYFRGELFGLGWQWNDLQWYYGAEPGALTVDENAVNLVIAPGARPGDSAIVKAERDGDYLHVVNNTTTGERSARPTIGIDTGVSDDEVRVWGEFPAGGRSFGAFLAIHNPALLAATLFKQTLIAHGIRVTGETASRDARVAENHKFDPSKANELAFVQSQNLAEVVRLTNKESNNLYAELILRTVGKEKAASVPDTSKPQRGDDEAGTEVINSWLASHGMDASRLAIRDGSGLSRLDLVTPESTVRLLEAIAGSNSATTFRDSLPAAGRDGTLRGRLAQYSGRIFGKTGTVVYVHSLSGYAVTPKGEVLAFSIYCNDAIGKSNPVRLIDQIAGLIADYDQPVKEK